MNAAYHPIPGYVGCYAISRHGVVVSIERTVNRSDGRTRRVHQRVLRQHHRDNGTALVSQVEQYGSVVTGFAASFATVELLSQIKRFEATSTVVSNEPLLSQTPGDIANPVNRRIFGVPLYSVPESTESLPTIPDGTVWAIAADKPFTVLRQDLSVMANPYSAFSSNSTQVRGRSCPAVCFPENA